MLTPGEGILNTSVVARMGEGNVQRLNKGGIVNDGQAGGGSDFTAFSESASKLSEMMNSFATSAAALAQAIGKMPTSLTGSFTHTVSINLNGAEVLAKLGPELEQMVTEKTKAELGRLFKEHLPEAGVTT